MKVSEFWFFLSELDEVYKKEQREKNKKTNDILFDPRFEEK